MRSFILFNHFLVYHLIFIFAIHKFVTINDRQTRLLHLICLIFYCRFALSYAAAELFVTCPLEMLDIFETVGV